MNKTAILLGATGLTGGILLDYLLQDEDFGKIIIFGRSSCEKEHPKIEEHLGDMFELEAFSEAFKGDVVFCCIGTTKAKTPNKETYKKIDYGIPVTAAKIAKQNEIEIFEVISAMGANINSSTFYNKVKGEMERDVLAQGIKNTYIFQPSLIGGDRDEKRLGERLAQIAMGTFGFLIPKQYKMIEPDTIARAMLRVSKDGFSEKRIASDKIKDLGNK
ncbi:NAD(P)H-binding protein [Jejudonia soesokkakensis]|uniref:NAD(P)H-binding protein n=1 Tax=Jejudonia soesokkakensis TaxID=1323432 RepID=A0ABW2MMZ3_9FLAO